MLATEAKMMTHGGLRARTAAEWRAQVRGTPSSFPKLVSLSGPRVASRLCEVPSGSARGRAGTAEGAGRGARQGGAGSDLLRGVGGGGPRESGFRGVGRNMKPDSGGCSELWSGAFAGARAARMPSPQTLPFNPLPPSSVRPGGGCPRLASGTGLRVLVLRCCWLRRRHWRTPVQG